MHNNYLHFWTELKSYIENNKWPVKTGMTPINANYYDIRFGFSGVHLSLHTPSDNAVIHTGLYIVPEERAVYITLEKYKVQLEQILGELEWIPDTGTGVSRIRKSLKIDLREKRNWPVAHYWLGLETFKIQEGVKLYLNK